MEAMSESEVFGKLLPLIVEVTGVDEDRIQMGSGLIMDLGAESIDLLDLGFLIEETLGVTIEADEFERQAVQQMGGVPYERDGLLTPEALEQLRRALPEVPPKELRPGMRKIDLPSLLTVAVFVHLIQRKLAAKQRGATEQREAPSA